MFESIKRNSVISSMFALLVPGLLGTVPASAQAMTLYVAPDGRDDGDGSADHPLTLVVAANRASQPHATTEIVLLPGVYSLTATVAVDCADCAVSLRANTKGTAILDGGNKVDVGLSFAGPGLAINGLVLRSFNKIGIRMQGVVNATIADNEIYNIHSNGWTQAAILGLNKTDQVTVIHNYIHDVGYAGIEFTSGPEGMIRNSKIIENTIVRSCQVMSDCGAIYVGGRSRASTGTVIRGNHIVNFGPAGLQGKGIYLDDGLSDAIVKRNFIKGPGDYAIQIHNGHGNRISGNVIDSIGSLQPILVQYSPNFDNGPMNGNTITGNTIKIRADQQGKIIRYINVDVRVKFSGNLIKMLADQHGQIVRYINVDDPITLSSNAFMNYRLPQLQKQGNAVPEPGTWMTMFMGLFLVGALLRVRRHHQPHKFEVVI